MEQSALFLLIFPCRVRVNVHPLKPLGSDLGGLKSSVLAMGGLVEKQLERTLEAIVHGNDELARQVLVEEDRINRAQVECDRLCSQILARRQPCAGDLREVVGALHSVNDLERIGDEAKKIALRLRETIPYADRWESELARVCRMTESVRAMLNQALDACVRGDPSVSAQLSAVDEQVDASRDALNAAVVVRMALEPGMVSQGLALIFMVQSLERIGDHAKNIAEHVVTVVDGVDRRHATGEGSRNPA